jgi:hypothetical protein
MKRNEKSKVEVHKNFVASNDQDLYEQLKCAPNNSYDESKPLFVMAEMVRLVKIEDWFKDGTTIVRTLRKGKGRNIYVDSTVSIRLSISVDGASILNNFPEVQPPQYS